MHTGQRQLVCLQCLRRPQGSRLGQQCLSIFPGQLCGSGLRDLLHSNAQMSFAVSESCIEEVLEAALASHKGDWIIHLSHVAGSVTFGIGQECLKAK